MDQSKRHFKRLHDDEWFDEIRFETECGPILRIITVPRYKTSELSGDEWRTSAAIQIARGDGHWEDFDRRLLNLRVAMQAIYPDFFTSHPELHNVPVTNISFYRKSNKVYESTYDGNPLPFLCAAGHLPWAFIQASEAGTYSRDLEEPFCFQPGCSEEAISTYRLKYEYCREGHETEPRQDTFRRFCQRHLQRGDCGLEDADANYEVVEGPGPGKAEGWMEFVSPSVFGGVIDLT